MEGALGLTPLLDVLFQCDGFVGARRPANGTALEVVVALDAGVVAGQHHHLEGEVGNGQADRLGAFQGVGGRGDDHVGTAGYQCWNTVGERGFDHFGIHAQLLRQVLAVIHVEACRGVVFVAETHGWEVERDRAAQLSGFDDVVEFVGLCVVSQGGAQYSGEG
ncbi:hypothetical protein D3C85_800860 [compost metagenome]